MTVILGHGVTGRLFGNDLKNSIQSSELLQILRCRLWVDRYELAQRPIRLVYFSNSARTGCEPYRGLETVRIEGPNLLIDFQGFLNFELKLNPVCLQSLGDERGGDSDAQVQPFGHEPG